MAVKTITVCDVTGEELVAPVRLGFNYEGVPLMFDVNQAGANQFVLRMASKLTAEQLGEVLDETFGTSWRKQSSKLDEDDFEEL